MVSSRNKLTLAEQQLERAKLHAYLEVVAAVKQERLAEQRERSRIMLDESGAER